MSTPVERGLQRREFLKLYGDFSCTYSFRVECVVSRRTSAQAGLFIRSRVVANIMISLLRHLRATELFLPNRHVVPNKERMFEGVPELDNDTVKRMYLTHSHGSRISTFEAAVLSRTSRRSIHRLQNPEQLIIAIYPSSKGACRLGVCFPHKRYRCSRS